MTPVSPFKAAACHVAPIYFDLDATVDKTCALIAEAARNGARIVAFPEAHLCAFPVWSGVRAPVENHEFFVRMAKSAVTIDHPAIQRIRRTARDHAIVVSIGINEASKVSVGCIWDTNLLIGADGALLNRHRKLVPTYWEKLTWTNGDGSGLRVVDTPVGQVDALELQERATGLGIGVAPGALFSSHGEYRRFIRLNCGMPDSARTKDGLLTLGRLIGELASTPRPPPSAPPGD